MMTAYVTEFMVKEAARRHQHPAGSTTITAVSSCCGTAMGERPRRRVHWPLDTTGAVEGLSIRIEYSMASHIIGRQEALAVPGKSINRDRILRGVAMAVVRPKGGVSSNSSL